MKIGIRPEPGDATHRLLVKVLIMLEIQLAEELGARPGQIGINRFTYEPGESVRVQFFLKESVN